MHAEKPTTISTAIQNFLEMTNEARSPNTARTYTNALAAFEIVLEAYELSGDSPASALTEKAISWFADELKIYAPATEQLYITAATRFYQYLIAEELAEINLQRLQMITQNRVRKPGPRLPQFPREDLDKVIAYAKELPQLGGEDENEHLRNYRDCAFIITLADTGLRVHEACNLRRGDVDWNEFRALVLGKGDRQAIVRFSSRAMQAIRDYINRRAALDGASGRPLPTLPIFARHDRGAGKKIKPITTATGRNIINYRVGQVLGKNAVGTITPHSFRHYFVTNVLQGSGGNLKLAQELARHQNIQVTQRYAHLSDDELDKGYHEIFE